MERTEPQFLERIYLSSVTWKICQYSKYLKEKDKTAIESPEFVTNLHDQIKWILSIMVKQECGKACVTECTVRRSAFCKGPSHILVKIRLLLKDSKGNVCFDYTRDGNFTPDFALTFECDKKSDPLEVSPLKTTGKIIVLCDFHQYIPLQFNQPHINDLWNLSRDLNAFYIDGNFTDLKLKVEKETFSVHSAIAKARSPLIARILNENPRRRQIDLTERCSIPMIKCLIAYWYSGNLAELSNILCRSTASAIRSMEQRDLESCVHTEVIQTRTTFKISKKSVKWVIEDMQLCEYLRQLDGGVSHSYKSEAHPWKLLFYPNGFTGNSDLITLSIYNDDGIGLNARSAEAFFRDENGTEYGSRSRFKPIFTRSMFSFHEFMTHEEFTRIRETILQHNRLRIGCRISWGSLIQDTNAVETLPLNKGIPFPTLEINLKCLLQSEDMSDISLISGDRIFRVHRAILAARSEYFNNVICKRKCRKSETQEISLNDITVDELDMILKYVYYAEKFVLNSELAFKLYPVFHKYQITSLKNVCSDYLASILNMENAFDIIELGVKFDDASLIQTARQFLIANWDRVSNAVGWLPIGY